MSLEEKETNIESLILGFQDMIRVNFVIGLTVGKDATRPDRIYVITL